MGNIHLLVLICTMQLVRNSCHCLFTPHLSLAYQLRQRAKAKLYGQYADDKDIVYHSGVSLVLAATKVWTGWSVGETGIVFNLGLSLKHRSGVRADYAI